MTSSPEAIVADYFQTLAADPSVSERLIGKQLAAAGHDAEAAFLVSHFGPIALGRMVLDGMGVSFSDEYLVANSDGSIAERASLSGNPYWSALEVGAQAHPDLGPKVGARSSEVNALNAALSDGGEPSGMVLAPLVMFNARPKPGAEDRLQASLARALKQPWWKFW